MSAYDAADAEAVYEAILRDLVPGGRLAEERTEAFVELPAGDPSPELIGRLGDRLYRLHPISDRLRLFGSLSDLTPAPSDLRCLSAHYFRFGPLIRTGAVVVVRVAEEWTMGARKWRFRMRRNDAAGYLVVERKLLDQIDY